MAAADRAAATVAGCYCRAVGGTGRAGCADSDGTATADPSTGTVRNGPVRRLDKDLLIRRGAHVTTIPFFVPRAEENAKSVS
jgi:hypothetical protein